MMNWANRMFIEFQIKSAILTRDLCNEPLPSIKLDSPDKDGEV